MLPSCDIAFKEWAAVCQALAAGRQSVIIRKGGIEEGPDGFQPKHDAFWLYPTQFHQTGDELQPDGRTYWKEANERKPEEGMITFRYLAIVEEVYRIEDEGQLPDWLPFTILSAETIHQRFHYREPGLFCLFVRVFESPDSVTIQESPEFAGCKSWVELEQSISTDGVVPVLSDDEFTKVRADLSARL